MYLRLYNSWSREKEQINTITPNIFKMYVCGPTLYDHMHIGNGRPLIVFDSLFKFLKTIFKEVIYVRNVTDVDDKIIERSEKLQIHPKVLVEEMTLAAKNMENLLQIENPSIVCNVTENYENIIKAIEKIIENGFAYVTKDGNVYYDLNKYDKYGCLIPKSRINKECARIQGEEDKKNWQDFVLWKRTNDALSAESPWGIGRPGWHIECSAMSMLFLGDAFDLHGGGQDLTFPHHENEIAQNYAICGHHVVKNWMHNGMVMVQGEKMSKSKGNFIYLKDVVHDNESAKVFRFLILSTHYHHPLNYSEDKLLNAKSNVKKFNLFLENHKEYFDAKAVDNLKICESMNEYKRELLLPLFEDFNSVLFITNIHSKIKEFKELLKNNSTEEELKLLYNSVYFMLYILGFE